MGEICVCCKGQGCLLFGALFSCCCVCFSSTLSMFNSLLGWHVCVCWFRPHFQEESESDGEDAWDVHVTDEARCEIMKKLDLSGGLVQHLQTASLLPKDFATNLRDKRQSQKARREILTKLEEFGRKGFAGFCKALEATGQRDLLSQLKSHRCPAKLPGECSMFLLMT